MSNPADETGIDEQVRTILTAWFEACERGESPDLAVFTRHDPVLMQRIRHLLDLDPFRNTHELEPAADDHLLRLGHLGDFVLEGLLGKGGMGRVYVARQPGLGRRVALKVLDSERVDGGESVVRFRREAETASSLEHPAIVPVYNFGQNDGHYWIAMKWLSGPSLEVLGGTLTPRRVAEIGRIVAEGLCFAHREGVIHRDIKPANIILDEDRPMIVDFGLSRAGHHTTVTRAGVVPGTLPFLAPECLGSDTAIIDGRSDIYSLGATLYYLLSGHLVFEAEHPAAMMAKILREEPKRPALPGADRDLATIILRCLEKEPERRFASAAELVSEFDRFLSGEILQTRPPGPLGRVQRRLRRHPRIATGVALALVLILLVGCLQVVAHLRRETRLDQEFQRTFAALREYDLPQASTLRSSLLLTHPADPRHEALRAEFEALVAYESLLDQVIAPPEDQSPRRIDSVISVAQAAETEIRINFPITRGAVILALLYLDRIPEAERLRASSREHVETEKYRTFQAIDQVLGQVPWGGVPVPVFSADDAVLTAALLRLANRSLSEIDAALDEAWVADPSSYRVLFARAVQHLICNEFARADEAFLALPLARRVNPEHDVYSLWAATSNGRMDRAARIFSTHPDPSPRLMLAYARTRELSGDKADALRFVDESLRRSRGDPAVEYAVLTWRMSHGDLAGAEQIIDGLMTQSESPLHGEWARILRLELDFETLQAMSNRGADGMKSLFDRVELSLKEARTPIGRGHAASLATKILSWLGVSSARVDVSRILEFSRIAVLHLPDDPGANVLRISACQLASSARPDLLKEVIQRVDSLDALVRRGRWSFGRHLLGTFYVHGAEAALQDKQPGKALSFVARAIESSGGEIEASDLLLRVFAALDERR